MDDTEYYAMMRRQYSHTLGISKKATAKQKSVPAGPKELSENSGQTAGSFSEWKTKYGHEDAEMFMERNSEEE